MIVHKIVFVATNCTPIHSSVVATNSSCVTHEVLAGVVSEQVVLLYSYYILKEMKK